MNNSYGRHPAFFGHNRVGIFLFALILCLFACFYKMHPLSQLTALGNPIPTWSQYFGTVLLICSIAIIYALMEVTKNSVQINDNTLTFHSWSISRPKTHGQIQLTDISSISDTYDTHTVNINKGVWQPITTTDTYLILQDKQKVNHKVPFYGWDKPSIKEVLKLIKAKYPSVSINTKFYQG